MAAAFPPPPNGPPPAKVRRSPKRTRPTVPQSGASDGFWSRLFFQPCCAEAPDVFKSPYALQIDQVLERSKVGKEHLGAVLQKLALATHSPSCRVFFSDCFDEDAWEVWLAYATEQQQVPFLTIITDPGEGGRPGEFEFTQSEVQEVLAARELARLVLAKQPLPARITASACRDSVINNAFWRNTFDMAGQILGAKRALVADAMFPDSVADLKDNQLRLWPTFQTIFTGNTAVDTLDLSKCPVLFQELGAAGLADVTDVIHTAKVRRVLLAECNLRGDLEDMAIVPRFEEIDLRGNKRVTGTLGALGHLTKMQKFNLANCTSVCGSLDALSSWRGLTSLNLYGLGNVRGDLSVLGRMKQLTELILGRCSNISGDLSDVGELGSLTSLDLSRCGRLTGELGELAGLSSLAKLSLGGSEQVEGNLEAMHTLTNLDSLNLTICGRVEGDVGVLVLMPGLRIIKLHGCRKLEGDLMALANLTKLEYVSVRRCQKVTTDAPAFKAALPECELFS